MTIDKLRSALNAHGVIFYELDGVFHCDVYSEGNDYDTLIINDNKLLCNNKPVNLYDWLGY